MSVITAILLLLFSIQRKHTPATSPLLLHLNYRIVPELANVYITPGVGTCNPVPRLFLLVRTHGHFCLIRCLPST
ncbi:hypothetical protein EDD18DRAFT_201030 [Armillaria luteobubalina]|uniref:Secreted protein n=1 Tax=Armillaria luteobubalina TaxID=153913 RepID=A0AA39Q6L5_9AGAR|nr:hypothetical protein EDD18DRAFT_201030 [Armillaria luteobubalina]